MLSTEAPSAARRLRIMRVPADTKAVVSLVSSDWVRLVTHFGGVQKSRTFLCPEVPECDACTYLSSRPYWYLPCRSNSTGQMFLLELSSHASAELEQRCRFVGSTVRPGIEVEMSRRSKRAPLRIEVVGQAASSECSPLHEWVSPLMAIFGFGALRPGETLDQYGARIGGLVLQRANLVAGQLKVAGETRLRSR